MIKKIDLKKTFLESQFHRTKINALNYSSNNAIGVSQFVVEKHYKKSLQHSN